ncbi:pentapeptide repeat-containing protein [Cupriavidus sp. AU9028]|uniref:pentapeptide repeat-containing protein n=1 Tax=Cupriavidus sp. AU9028 TaxID=2871157 RepID=UPI001C93BC3C|nr:pentapeptide repeat-containing protein [Cupriavidus sp. AU9028]MBY4897418.1 pentapeptide repeat-containing protein [Cupriavidus sp. AU9028]
MTEPTQFRFPDSHRFVDALHFKDSALQSHLREGRPIDVGRWRFRLVAGDDEGDFEVTILPPDTWWCRLWLRLFPRACDKVRQDIAEQLDWLEGQWCPKLARPYIAEDQFTGKIHLMHMRRANLRGASLWGWKANCGLGGDFTGADLSGASLKSLTICGTSFQGADLSNCNLESSRLVGVDFRDASFENTTLRNVNMLSCCNFTGVSLTTGQIRLADTYISDTTMSGKPMPETEEELVHLTSGLLRTLTTIRHPAVREELVGQLIDQLTTHAATIVEKTGLRARAVVNAHLSEWGIFLPQAQRERINRLTPQLLPHEPGEFGREIASILALNYPLALPAKSLPPRRPLQISFVSSPSSEGKSATSCAARARRWLALLPRLLTLRGTTGVPVSGR